MLFRDDITVELLIWIWFVFEVLEALFFKTQPIKKDRLSLFDGFGNVIGGSEPAPPDFYAGSIHGVE